MSGSLAWAVLFGLLGGAGAVLIVSGLPRFGRRPLAARIASQLVDVSPYARELSVRRRSEVLPLLGPVASRALSAARARLAAVLGGGQRLELQLRRAGRLGDLDPYRLQQLLALLTGAGAGGALALLGGAAGLPVLGAAALPATGAVAGVVVRDRLLARAAKARMARIAQELPTTLEFLSMALSAGEGVHDALRRVARVGSGALAAELRLMMGEVAAGVPLGTALTALSAQLQIPALTRALDHLVAALDRGAPLADVLRAQAQDARDLAARDLLELAGRKEVGMLVPLVFVILPFTVVIAVWPGLIVLRTGF